MIPDLLLYMAKIYAEEHPEDVDGVRAFLTWGREWLSLNRPSLVTTSVPGIGITFADGTQVSLAIPSEDEGPVEQEAYGVMAGPSNRKASLDDGFAISVLPTK